MKVLFFTREFPPYVYGGAGVHVEYLADELAKLMKVDVRCFGDQDLIDGNLRVKGFPYDNPNFKESNSKLKAVLETLSTGIHMKSQESEADFDAAAKKKVELVAFAKANKEIPIVAMKPTALGRFALWQKVSEKKPLTQAEEQESLGNCRRSLPSRCQS